MESFERRDESRESVVKSSIEDITAILRKHGYTIIDEIVIGSIDDQMVTHAITNNKFGEYVVVELNIPGEISITDDNFRETIEDSGEFVTEECKSSYCDCIGLCSVAIDCQDGICMLKKEGQWYNLRYTTPHRNGEKIPIAYPLSKLSDIIKNSEAVLLSEHTITIKIRTEALKKMVRKIQLLKSREERAIDKSNSLKELMGKIQESIVESFNGLREEYSSRGGIRQDAVHKKMRRINDKLIDFILLSDLIDELSMGVARYEDLIERIYKQFKKLEL